MRKKFLKKPLGLDLFSVLDLYILQQFVQYFLRVAGLFLLLLILVYSLRFHHLIIEYGAPTSSIFALILLAVPVMINVIIPFSGVFASIALIGRLVQQNELIIMRQVGLSNAQLLRPLLMCGFVLAAFGWLNGAIIQPLATQQFNQINRSFRHQEFNIPLKPGKFNYLGDQMMFYANNIGENGLHEDLLIVQDRGESSLTIIAENGRFNNNFLEPGFILYKGSIQEHNKNSNTLEVIEFDTYQLRLAEKEVNKISYILESDERFLPDLLFPDVDNRADIYRYDELVSKGHDRLSSPLYFVMLPLIAALLMINAPFERRRSIGTVISVTAICLGLFILHRLSLNLAASSAQWLLLTYSLIIGNMLLLYRLWRREKYLPINIFQVLYRLTGLNRIKENAS